jgi:hypothetical protein
MLYCTVTKCTQRDSQRVPGRRELGMCVVRARTRHGATYGGARARGRRGRQVARLPVKSVLSATIR